MTAVPLLHESVPEVAVGEHEPAAHAYLFAEQVPLPFTLPVSVQVSEA